MPDPKADRYVYTIKETGANSGADWYGQFTFRTKLSFRDQLRRDELRRELIGPTPAGTLPSPRADSIADLFSEIWTHLVDAPPWWKDARNGLDLEDENVLAAVYDCVLKAKAEAAKGLKKGGEEAKADLEKLKP